MSSKLEEIERDLNNSFIGDQTLIDALIKSVKEYGEEQFNQGFQAGQDEYTA